MGKKRRNQKGSKRSSYFASSIIGFPLEVTDMQGIKERKTIFRRINSSKPNKHHSANKIYRNDSGKIVAIRCNCGKKTFHSVHNGLPNWRENLSNERLIMLRGGN